MEVVCGLGAAQYVFSQGLVELHYNMSQILFDSLSKSKSVGRKLHLEM